MLSIGIFLRICRDCAEFKIRSPLIPTGKKEYVLKTFEEKKCENGHITSIEVSKRTLTSEEIEILGLEG